MRKFADIAVELPIDGSFTYSIPAELSAHVKAGRRVLVGFGKRTVTGYVISTHAQSPSGVKRIKPVIDTLDSGPVFDAKRLRFYQWLSSYYCCSLGTALSLALPSGASIKSKRRLRITTAGKAAFKEESGLALAVLSTLSKAKNGTTLASLVKQNRGKPVHNTIGRLLKNGLVSEESELKGGAGPRVELWARVDEGCAGRTETEALLKRSPAQRRLYDFLTRSGEASVGELRAALGTVSGPLKGLVDKGLVVTREKLQRRDPLGEITPKRTAFEPNPEQQEAIDEITRGLNSDTFSPYLLYGVTGSGKTLVYLKVLEEALRKGKKAVFLAPEIALTSGPAAYLIDRFGSRVGLAHSALSEGERMDEWRRIMAGEVDVVVGARSALFSPLKDLGLIIIDEEHETSYKQEEGTKYNARNAALMLGSILGITVVLGSATPSVESFFNAANGKLRPIRLGKRVLDRTLPSVEVVDMRGEKNKVLSERLVSLMAETLEAGHQVLLFLNRRGFSSFIICRDCGRSFTCPNCSVTLTMHKRAGELRCHYCDISRELPHECPGCAGVDLVCPRAGTEKIEEEVRSLFPEAVVERMDRDTTRKKGSAQRIMDAVEERRVDVLIGTQMVSKGHDFPGITLVGVISADTALSMPDFRGAERTFQLITQAAGRAGRGTVAGRVVIQTFNPDHYCFTSANAHDYDAFYASEIGEREDAEYPPFTRLCNLRLEGADEQRVIRAAELLKALAKRAAKKSAGITILGPAPAPLVRLKGRYRWQMLVKAASNDPKKQGSIKGLNVLLRELLSGFEAKKPAGVSLIVDMDPITIL